MVTFKKILAQSFIWLILIIIYLPVLMLIAFSFNDTTIIGSWHSGGGWNGTGLTGELYVRLFQNKEIWTAVANTAILAITSGLVSTLLGTLCAIGSFYSKRRTSTILDGINNIPIVNAEVVIAMSLTVMFVFAGNMIFKTNLFSFWTLLIGHVVIGLPFVYLNVKPKLQQMNPELYEAALDLNANPAIALRRVIFPQVAPGVFSGFLLAISLSLDDLIITNFTAGPGLLSGEGTIVTLSTMIQAKIVKGAVPAELRPLTLLIFLLVVSIVVVYTMINNFKANKASAHAKRRNKLLNEEAR